MTEESAAFIKYYAAPVIGVLSIVIAIFAWIINIQSEVAFIKATQETVVRELGRHDGMLENYQLRGSKIDVLANNISEMRQEIDDLRRRNEERKR